MLRPASARNRSLIIRKEAISYQLSASAFRRHHHMGRKPASSVVNSHPFARLQLASTLDFAEQVEIQVAQ
jgi:hypothetical protein